jgi:hypothetical protein
MLMKVKTAALFGVTLVLLAGSAAHAATLSFNFVFTNASNGGGTVTGVVEGLIDNNTTSATSVRVLSNTLGFGLGEYAVHLPITLGLF